ncbi:MAG: oxidoreductase family protein, partial [Polyangiales bacterium]
VRFYRELAPEIGVGTAHCYFAHYDRERGRFCLLLEDLSPARSADIVAGLSFEQAKVVLEQIAALHARWWNRVDEVAWLLLSEQMVRTLRDRFVASLPRFTERFGAQYPELTKIAAQMGELLTGDELLGKLSEPPLTLAHNDLHLNNVFLPSEAGGHFALIDWQGVSGSRHGTTDVARILCMGMRPEERRAHTDALLRHYHQALCRHGVRGYSLRSLRRRYREEMTAAVIIGVLAFDTLDFDVPGGQLAATMIGQRVDLALRDARVGRLLLLMLVMIRIRRFFARIFGGSKALGPGTGPP